MRVLLRRQDRDFIIGFDVTKGKLHGETIHLRFGKRIGAAKLDWVLRGDDEKQVRKIASLAVHTHLAFAHGFEQNMPATGQRGEEHASRGSLALHDSRDISANFFVNLASRRGLGGFCRETGSEFLWR